jgi:hypothetical protein
MMVLVVTPAAATVPTEQVVHEPSYTGQQVPAGPPAVGSLAPGKAAQDDRHTQQACAEGRTGAGPSCPPDQPGDKEERQQTDRQTVRHHAPPTGTASETDQSDT